MLRNSFAFRSFSHFFAAIFLLLGVLGPTAYAQAATEQEMQAFMANPAQALAQFPDGGAALVSLIRDVANSHPEALQSIMSLLPNASDVQQQAMGAGLGQAAQIAVTTNPTYASQIQNALAASGSQNAIAAFSAATGNVQIAAGGPGGGGGGVGGPTGSGPPGGGGGGSGGGFGGGSGGGLTGGGQTYNNAGLGGGNFSSASVSPR